MELVRTLEVGVEDYHLVYLLIVVQDNLPVPANATVLQLPSCGLAYQSQCTVSCYEGFTGDDITYLCNVTNDATMVDWVPISNTETKSDVPERFVTAL